MTTAAMVVAAVTLCGEDDDLDFGSGDDDRGIGGRGGDALWEG